MQPSVGGWRIGARSPPTNSLMATPRAAILSANSVAGRLPSRPGRLQCTLRAGSEGERMGRHRGSTHPQPNLLGDHLLRGQMDRQMGRRSLKSDFMAAVAARCFLRLEVVMLPGDAQPTAVAVAHKVGCSTSSQEVRPEDKAAEVSCCRLRNRGWPWSVMASTTPRRLPGPTQGWRSGPIAHRGHRHGPHVWCPVRDPGRRRCPLSGVRHHASPLIAP